jgi:hypothetical protein
MQAGKPAEVAACTSATISGLGARVVISQPAPTSCIQEPMFDTTDAIHSVRNTRWRSGAHADNDRSLTGLVLMLICCWLW